MSGPKCRLIQIVALATSLLTLNACASTVRPAAQTQAPPTPVNETAIAAPTSVPTLTLTPIPNSPTDVLNPTPPAITPTEVTMPKPQAKIDESQFKKAPPLFSATWINSQPLTLDALRGKVVVVDFWTFACINCQHVLPYLKAWDQKYRAQGLVIIGVHTPELSFERDVANVKQAVQDDAIQYPIAIDGDYANWNRYHVWAWPTWFIVDKEGYIRYNHVGEGDYSGSEATIRQLLSE